MQLRIATWSNDDHSKKVVRTSKGLDNFYSIHEMVDERTNISFDEFTSYRESNNLKYIDTITIEVTVTI